MIKPKFVIEASVTVLVSFLPVNIYLRIKERLNGEV